jgi:hypothetical protein
MAQPPQKFFVRTVAGNEISVNCPICRNDTFLTVRAPASGEGRGFQHVIVGRELLAGDVVAGPAVALPVRFQACSNCGYVLKFLVPVRS